MNTIEFLLQQMLAEKMITDFKTEFKFCSTRKWRADYAIPEYKILIECEGGSWAAGRHVRGQGYENDCEKYNAATVDGWRVLRYTTTMINRNLDAIIKDVAAIIKGAS
jgi:very-short-patch-repair endonuclease